MSNSVMRILSVAVAASAAVGIISTRFAASAAAPESLTPANFERLKARVAPAPRELAWQQVPWRDGFFEGLREAQAADKPLFYWIYEGDPRGNC